MIVAPDQSSKKWQPSPDSDLFGNLFVTKNLTFDKRGYLNLSSSPRLLMNESVDADFDEPAAILRSEDYGYFIATHDQCFEMDEDQFLFVRPTQVATAGVPSGDIQTDVCFASGLMVMTQDSDVDYYDPAANTWTDTNISLTATSQSQHPCEKFLSLGAVAIANVNTVLLYTSPLTATPTLLATLTIFADFYVTSLAYFNQNLYIGTMNRFGGKAALYVWNGYGSAAQSVYEVDSNIIYDIEVHSDSVFCFTGTGQVLRFNGTGFTEKVALPSFRMRRPISDETNLNMYHNCLKSKGDLLYVNVSDSQNEDIVLSQPSGIWCYDSRLDIFYHRYTYSNSLNLIDTIATASVVIATDLITVAAAPFTGTEVIYDAVGGTVLGGLTDKKKYYAIFVDATHIRLATTRALALAGTYIDLTGTGNSSQKLISFPNGDYGQFSVGRVQAICPIERIIDESQYGTDVLWGGTVYDRQLGSGGGLCTVSPVLESRAYFVTPKIFSNQIQDTFNLITLKFSPFISDINKIIIKYRLVDDMRDVISPSSTRWRATWTSSTTFTTSEIDFANAVVGDEIEFLRGAASGLCAHITSIPAPVAGVYTVTIDEAFNDYTASDVSVVVFRNWKKWQTITYRDKNDLQGFLSTELGKKAKMIQFKVELRGVGIRIEEFMVDNLYKLSSMKSKSAII